MEIPNSVQEASKRDHPWMKMAGIWNEDDPLVQEWEEVMKENRRRADEDPNFK